MLARVMWLEGQPDHLERTITAYEPRVAAPLREAPGYRGARLLANREDGTAAAVTYWESWQALGAVEMQVTTVSSETARATGTHIVETERYEVVLQERTAPAQAHTFVRVDNVRGSPERVEDSVGLLREQVVPLLMVQQGFRSVVAGINRQTGRLVITTVWQTAADRDASESSVGQVLRRAGQLVGSSGTTVERYEIAFAENWAPASPAAR